MNRPPDEIDDNGHQFWYDDNHEFHNDNGYPAIIYKNESSFWYKHGLHHNENGPAIIWLNGTKRWWVDGEHYTKEEFKQYKIKQFIYGK